VFEAVNMITGDNKPYFGTVVAPAGASAGAAVVAAAYQVLKERLAAGAESRPRVCGVEGDDPPRLSQERRALRRVRPRLRK
jgi:hypothetical protein